MRYGILFLYVSITYYFSFKFNLENVDDCFFNSSIVVLSILLCYLVYGDVSIYPVPKVLKSFVGLVNLFASGGIIFVIMLYFSWAINKKDEALVNVNIALVNQNKKIIGQHDNLEVLLK